MDLARYCDILSVDAENTFHIAESMGKGISRSLVIALTGELGSGKTLFVKGLAKGLCVPDEYYITSPTFTLVNQYPGRIPLYHADLYRLGSLEELEETGLFEPDEEQFVLAVEWADRAGLDSLMKIPTDFVSVCFLQGKKETERIVRFGIYPDKGFPVFPKRMNFL